MLTDEFRPEALRPTVTSCRTFGQVAADVGIGKSTPTWCKARYHEADPLLGPLDDVQKAAAFSAEKTSR